VTERLSRRALTECLVRRGIEADVYDERSICLYVAGQPEEVNLLLERTKMEGSPDMLDGWRPRVLVCRDYPGELADGRKLGLWWIWTALYRAGLVKAQPPLRWQSLETRKKRRKRR